MSTAVRRVEEAQVERSSGTSPPGSLRRLGSAIGLVTISMLDLLALDDITTAGARMPEIGFVVASIPALVTLAYFTFRRTARPSTLPDHDSNQHIAPPPRAVEPLS